MMNRFNCFGDTFDNISFAENGKNKTNNFSESVQDVFSSEDFMCSFNNPKKSISSQSNITVDDSIFLQEFNSSQMFGSTNLLHNEVLTVSIALNHIQLQETSKTQRLQEKSINLRNNLTTSLLDDTYEYDIKSNSDVLKQHEKCHSDTHFETEKCFLTSWGLPTEILEKYKQRNVIKMFNWQVECLSNNRLFNDHCNLVYSAPTSAGKTLVAEILAIKTVIERQRKVLFVLPFVSVVREKMFYLKDILNTSGVRVEGFMGSYSAPGGFQAVQVAVCTIEKANSLVNRMLEDGTLGDVGMVIIDEIHLLGDVNRGYLLELLITKLLYMSRISPNFKIQIVGMSATLPNLNLLGKWLDAEVYTTDFRPIPLHEQWLLDNSIYDKNLQLQRTIQTLPELDTDMDNILYLCLETIQSSCSVLIFCPTKNWCENLAQQIALAFWKLGCSDSSFGLTLRQELNTELIRELLEQLKQCPSGLDKILEKPISFGVSFHHAGLTMDERDIIEAAFRRTTLRVLVATSTLSSGVNLPARRVIIRTPMFHGKPLDSLVYQQMIGRAGRMGKDSSGESILICQKNNYEVAKELVSSNLKPIRSCLDVSGILNRALLEVVASGIVTTPEDVKKFSNCTLFAVTAADDGDDEESLCNPVTDAIDFLSQNEFIRLQELEDGTFKYLPTSLGKACLSSSMSPEEGLSIFLELQQARQCFVLESELHLIYVVTPYSTCNQWGSLDWMLFLEMWEKLPASMKRVGELVGVQESYIVNATRNKVITSTSKMYRKLQVHKRFFTALALQDLVNEVPINEVAIKYGCSRGMLQSLQQSSSTFAGMLTIFSRQLGWSSMEILIAQFQDRLQFGISRDLLDLMKLSLLNGPRARNLYNAGIETLTQLASADITLIENILYKVSPFESKKVRDGESEYDMAKRNKMKTVWITGKEGLTAKDAAVMLVEEARRYLKLELGLVEAKWERNCESEEIIKNKDSVDEVSTETTFNEEQVPIITSNNDTVLETSNQSLFEGSFEVTTNATSLNCDNIDKKKSNDSGLEFDNGSFLENAFLTCGNDERNDTNSQTSQVVYDFVDSSQSVLNAVISFKDISSTSTKRTSGIVQRKYSGISTIDNDFVCSPSKKRKIEEEKFYKDVDLKTLDIVDVCKDIQLYNTFSQELHQQTTVSLSFACTKYCVPHRIIGSKAISENTNTDCVEDKHPSFSYKNTAVEGVAVSWGNNIAYYISFENKTVVKNNEKIELLKKLLCKNTLIIRLFDCKEQLKVARRCCGLEFEGIAEDCKVGDWLLDPDGQEKNLHAMAVKYAADVTNLLQFVGHSKGVGSVGLDIDNAVEGRIRSSVESVTSWHVSSSVANALQQGNPQLYSSYKTEMKSLICVTRMELNGIRVDLKQLHNLIDILQKECENLQNEAFSHVGRRFSFTSSTEIAKILGLYKGKRCTTNKQTLQRHTHPISQLVLQWRKLNSTLVKMIYPLVKLVENDCIYGTSIIHTSTGRISMHEPNLQNVPRDFEINIPRTNLTKNISCRSAFVASENCSFLSSDYCQLELRILAHLCGDPTLCSIMKTNNDVFKLIAAHWKGVKVDEVDDTLRQWTKQLCYGIIYGMGVKALAEHLSVTEEQAKDFMDSFKKQYSNIQIYIQKIINKCREVGYVETYSGRRRYLPNICHENSVLKGQAERQAVNTTIQGSAADITKLAMMTTENRFRTKYRHSKNLPKLVLHLHDELLYEVQDKYLFKTAKILRQAMEDSVKLSIPFPVKLKSGKSWGTMKELFIEI